MLKLFFKNKQNKEVKSTQKGDNDCRISQETGMSQEIN